MELNKNLKNFMFMEMQGQIKIYSILAAYTEK